MSTLALILGVTALETYIHWPTISDAETAGSFWRKLWLAASKKGFQTTLNVTLLWLPFGLVIEKIREVFMRFLNRDATIEKARESARAEFITEIRAEARAEGRAEGRAEVIAEVIAEIRAESDREWTAYTARLKAALERGEPFNEPPPSRSPQR